jgi:asparagine synthase (glutamine-hydrolysing)
MLRLRTGALRYRLPAHSWDEKPLAEMLVDRRLAVPEAFLEQWRQNAPRFFFSPEDRVAYAPLLRAWDTEAASPIAEADALETGTVLFFSHANHHCGVPADWHKNAFSGESAPRDRHWSAIGDFACGDIKVIWEPNRFEFTYALVRAYWRTADERYPEIFWRLVQGWREQNPPQQGVNWKCGQEATFRAMAWFFGLFGFSESPTTTAERVFRLVEVLGLMAHRIEANIDYAIAQANNHGISEAVGLCTIGTLLPELAAAERWREHGRAVLETEARNLIYDDGSFSQHSFNYQRLMLHDYLWAIRLSELNNAPFTRELTNRIGRAGEFLYQLHDVESGSVSNYGHNDGALILPLNNCGYRDYRPVIGASAYLAGKQRVFADGPWCEDLLWLFGPASLAAEVVSEPPRDFRGHSGGYYTLRSQESFVFTRCGTFKHRPAQADMLHMDLWWRGQNIAQDAGTYSYNAPEPWFSSFSGTAVHNTVSVDGMDQMERVGRFLWLPWLRGRLITFQRFKPALALLEAEHDGYERLKDPVTYRRAIVQIGADSWLVVDALASDRAAHEYRLHWLLADAPNEFNHLDNRLVLRTHAGNYDVQVGTVFGEATCSLVRADEQTGRGWSSPFYYHREPALSLAVVQQAKSTQFWTLFSPQKWHVEVDAARIFARSDSSVAIIDLALEARGGLVRDVRRENSDARA